MEVEEVRNDDVIFTRWVRDSKLGDKSPQLGFTENEWQDFIAGVRAGEFD